MNNEQKTEPLDFFALEAKLLAAGMRTYRIERIYDRFTGIGFWRATAGASLESPEFGGDGKTSLEALAAVLANVEASKSGPFRD